MKRKILIITVLLLAVTMLFAVKNTVKAAALEDETGAVVKVVDSNGTKYYDNLLDLNSTADVQAGAEVTLLDDVELSNYVLLKVNMTFNFNGNTISASSGLAGNAPVMGIISGAKVILKGNGGIVNEHGGAAILLQDASTAIFNGGTYVTNGTPISGIAYPTVSVNGSTIEVNNGTILKNELGVGTLSLRNASTATLNKGTFSQTGTSSDNKNYASVECDASTLIVNEGAEITSKNALGIFAAGTNPKVTINDGAIITSKSFAVSGNGSTTTNSTIIINGGTLTSTGTAAIYHPESGTLTINDGTIEGYYGIVSRQGTVDVKGGTITATGTEPKRVGSTSEDVLLPVGAIVTDNNTSGYSGDTTVTVTDGNINGAIAGYEDDDNDDFDLIGGAFSVPIPTEYLEDSLEVKKGDTYYLGDNAEDALSNAKEGDKLSVINGNVNLNGIHNGVVVTNEGSGKVTLNGQEIKTGDKPTPVVNQTELDLADLEDRLAKLEKDLNDEKANEDKAKAELEDLKARVDSLEKENKDLKDRVAKLEEKVAKLEKAQEKAPAADAENSEELDDEPKTGDVYAVSAGLVSLLSLVGAVVSKRFIK